MSASGPLTMREIISVTAQHFDLSVTEMLSPRRDDRLVAARQAAAIVIKELLPRSYPEIGRALGGRDHTTIMNAIASGEERCVAQPTFSAKVFEILKYCRAAQSLAPPDINPFEEAARILSEPRAATGASVETIRNLVAIAVAALQEATRQEVETARTLAHQVALSAGSGPAITAEVELLRVALQAANDEIVRLANRPTPLEIEVRDYLAAERRLGMCSAAGERAARQHVERAKIALSLAAETHFNIKRSFK